MNKEKLIELKNKINDIDITYDYESTYCDLYNTTIDYMNETQDFDFEYLFDNFIDYELAEEYAKMELKEGGLIRLRYFLGDVDLDSELFRVNGYGNLDYVDIIDLENLKDEILSEIERKLEE